jgi:hypothetical protein
MDYLQRYLEGEFEQVWSDLQALGPAIWHEPHYSAACAVAAETMRRVRRNCELIVARLYGEGYIFGRYPDGSDGYYGTGGPLVTPTPETKAAHARVEARVGPLPLSLAAFWREVGSVDLVGMPPSWPALLDPLVVYGPDAAIEDIEAWDEDWSDGYAPAGFEVGLAPDDLHKDNISGGPPYSVALPDPSADFKLLNERHGLLFVPYLRLAILRWGGFPGLDGREVDFKVLDVLVSGLEPF